MKRLSALLIALFLVVAPAYAQPIHGAPQGVTHYDSPADWPWLTAQTHWKNEGIVPNPAGPLVPGISHTHIECHAPIWAELAAGPITLSCTLRLFETDGQISLVWAQFMGASGDAAFQDITMDAPLPFVGDPTPGALLSTNFHVTFDPSQSFLRDQSGNLTDQLVVEPHGWFNTRIVARTNYNSGVQTDTEFWIPYFSILDPSQPEPAYGEGVMEFASKGSIQGPDIQNGGVGLQVTELRGTESQARGYLPILAPFSTPQIIFPLTYNYKFLTLAAQYDLRLDANFHMGIAGTVLANTQTEIPGLGVSNVDTLDPAVIGASTAIMGTTPGKHRVIATWQEDTGIGGDGFGPNMRILTLLGFEVAVGDVPPPPPPTLVAVPNVVGLAQAQATSAISASGLLLGSVALDPLSLVAAGTVTSQSPAAGTQAPLGSAVSVVVSSFAPPPPPAWVTVPGFMQQLGTQFQFCTTATLCKPVLFQ